MALLDDVIGAHGGRERWADVRMLSLRVRIRGNILLLRLQSPRIRPLDVSVDTQRVRISLEAFPRRGMIGHLDGHHLRIERSDGRQPVAEREVRRTAGGRVVRRLIWDDLDLLYFLGYSLWNYAVTPFVFLWPGFQCREGTPLREANGATLRALHVTYPPGFPAHSREQTCYFDDVGLLRRIDYTADAADFHRYARTRSLVTPRPL